MKPFNLEAALAGAKVIRADGAEVVVTKLAVPTGLGSELISQKLDGETMMWHTLCGKASMPYGFDLAMAPTTRTIYINLWDSPSFHYSKYDTREEARLAYNPNFTILNSEPIAITIEE